MTRASILYKNPANATLTVREDTDNYSENNQNSNKKAQPKLLKRIRLDKLMDLKVDYAFKQLFGNEKNKHITVVFLNAILQQTGRKPIKDISFANIEIGGEYEGDKQSRLDLLVMTGEGEQINIEIQFTNRHNMIKRTLFYWSRVYTTAQQKGMNYKELRPVITINILNYDLFDQDERFHTMYHLREDRNGSWLTDVMEIHFIEMGKLLQAWKNNELDPWNDVLARWLLLLGMVDHRNHKVYDDIYLELEAIAMNDEALREAFNGWNELSMTHRERLEYESRLKAILDQEDWENEKREIQELKRTVKEFEKKVKEQENTVKERESVVKEQENAVKERQSAVKEQENAVKEQQSMVKEQENAAKERQSTVREQESTTRERENTVKEQENRVKEREQKSIVKSQELAQKEKEMKDKEQEIERKHQEAELKQRENNWKLKEAEKRLEEMARQLLASGMDAEWIAGTTGLSQERIAEIKEDIQK